MKDKFAVFILTHGRADNVKTVRALRNQGYTGDIYFVCDTSDKQLDLYKKNFGDKVLVFNKDDVAGTFDKMDTFGKKNVVVYARNAVYELAKSIGIKYIAVLDDDYSVFELRVNKSYEYERTKIKNLDNVFKIFLDFLIETKIKTISFSQGGDFIGGETNQTFAVKKETKRKAMNLFFFDVDNPMEFMGTINEDLTASLAEGQVGNVVLTCPLASLEQMTTQQNKGGLTDIYLDLGTYVKSFYSVMYAPSAVTVKPMGACDLRMHHSVKWNNIAPKIIREDVRGVIK